MTEQHTEQPWAKSHPDDRYEDRIERIEPTGSDHEAVYWLAQRAHRLVRDALTVPMPNDVEQLLLDAMVSIGEAGEIVEHLWLDD